MNEKKDSAKELIALISASVHDMKTPLTSIAGFADAIIDGKIPDDQRNHYLGVIRDEAGRLEKICEELLDASKIETGTLNFSFSPFDICECARRVIISLETRIASKKLDLLFKTDRDSIIALGDEGAITRVLYNILENAVKFSYTKGKLSININDFCDEITVCVENTGEGMSKTDVEDVFLPFYKRDSSGTGLAMYISKSIIDAHGGKIWAESTEGESTAFTFRINRG